MSSFKNLADLKSLSQQLKQQEESRQRAEAERLEREKKAREEANIFRSSVGKVEALKTVVKHHPAPHVLNLCLFSTLQMNRQRYRNLCRMNSMLIHCWRPMKT
ncbi:hypothetical protein UNDYM_2114 [Undibacterium sp. YM2]|nr:hypothetical protein UNDYM_2114 [Undibacterium sp. YM2]